MVRFGPECVDFTSHFLTDKSEFLALPLARLQGFEEIFQVIVESMFFFIDVEFLDVENHLLFKSVFVVIEIVDFVQSVDYPTFYLFDALFFVRFYLL